MARHFSSDASESARDQWSARGTGDNSDPSLGETRLREIADTYVPQALDKFESSVDSLRRLTTDRAVAVIGYAIFGLAIGVAGLIALIGLLIVSVRLADVYGPGPLWAWYLGLAGVFFVAGVLLWRRSTPRPSTDA